MASSIDNSLSPPTFHLMAYPWDFPPCERGTECGELSAMLDQLRGEVGLGGLSVWGAASAVRQFRVGPIQPRLFHSDGGLFFEPVQNRGGCRPTVTTTGSRSQLPAIAHACQRADLGLRLLLSTAAMGGLAQYYPEFASRSAFDDVSRMSVCLLNPAVQECISGVACNVPPQFGVQQVVLHDFEVGWFEALDEGIRWPCAHGNVERSILATCFCPACVKTAQAAGVDAEEARASVRSLVQKSWSQGTSFGGNLAGFLSDQPALTAFRGIQTDQLNLFLKQIVGDCRMEVFVARSLSEPTPRAGQIDWTIPAGVVAHASDLAQLSERFSDQTLRSEVNLSARLLVGSRAETFVAAMPHLAEYGYAGVQIEDHASLPGSAYTTLKQAIRFARRSAAL
jgi:hypothetical protein